MSGPPISTSRPADSGTSGARRRYSTVASIPIGCVSERSQLGAIITGSLPTRYRIVL